MTEATADRLVELGKQIGATDLLLENAIVEHDKVEKFNTALSGLFDISVFDWEEEIIRLLSHSIGIWQEYWQIVDHLEWMTAR